MLAEQEPKTFAVLLRALLPLNVHAKVDQKISFATIAEAEAAMRERGIPISEIFKLEHHPDILLNNIEALDDDNRP